MRHLFAIVVVVAGLLVASVILLWHWVVAGAVAVAAWKIIWRRAERRL